ncbi:MAG: hypothetical protein IPK19_26370 [Chloroflexi bacterium]|nr:hypothetical protein [Chloroflexota bacterium]
MSIRVRCSPESAPCWSWPSPLVLIATGVIRLPTAAPSTSTPNPLPTPIPHPVVMEDEIGYSDDASPSSEEIQMARARVGDSGFIAYAAWVQSSQYHAAQAREIAGFAAAYGLRSHL